MNHTIIIGTRGSKLALAQVELTWQALLSAFPDIDVQVKIIKTIGDVMLDVPLSGSIAKGFFTSEIEAALFAGTIDLAVHSMKDLPVGLPEGLTIGGVLPRADARDVLVSNGDLGLNQLPEGATVCTSSLRRRLQLLSLRPDVTVGEIRGNVDTRLRKMESGVCDAQILAAAGLVRLGLESRIATYLDPKVFVPAPAQGAIAIECRANDAKIRDFLGAINHDDTRFCADTERSLLTAIGGGCHLPFGCYCEPIDQGYNLYIFVANADGSNHKTETMVITRHNAAEMVQQKGKEIQLVYKFAWE